MIGISYFQSYKHRDFLIFRDKVSDPEKDSRFVFEKDDDFNLLFQKLRTSL